MREPVVDSIDKTRRGLSPRLGWTQVVALGQDHMAHPTARVVHVAVPPGDQMDVEVTDRLPSGITVVEPHVVAIRRQLIVQLGPYLVEQIHEVDAFLRVGVPPPSDESPDTSPRGRFHPGSRYS